MQLNLAFPRRWWKAGEEFAAELWVVNDYHRPWARSKVSLRIFAPSQQPFELETDIDVPSDCARKLCQARWSVPEGIEEFLAILELRDSFGTVLCVNRYRFSVDVVSNVAGDGASASNTLSIAASS